MNLPNSLRRLSAIATKEIRQLRRDRLTFGMIVGVPLLQILLFGYAINLDVRHLRAGVVDYAQTSASRALVRAAQATQVLDIVSHADSVAELETQLQRGEIVVGIVLPADLERRLQDRSRPAGQLLIDGSDPTIEGIAGQLLNLPVPLGGAVPVAAPAPTFALRPYYNPEHRSAVNIVPGLVGVILNLTMVLFTAVAIVRERERGNLEMLITTPVRTPELMLGKILPYIVIGYVQLTLILLLGAWLFDVPLAGSLADLLLAALFFIAATLALGLLISTLAQTQFQAMQLTVFTFLPSILLSGFMFPFDGMPTVARWLAELLPLTHFVRLTRGIMLRGAELWEMPMELMALTIFFTLMLVLALLRFRKRLD